MATGANTTPLGRLNPTLSSNIKAPTGSSLLKPSYMTTQPSGKRSSDESGLELQSTNWPPEMPERSRKKRRSRWGGDDKDKVFIPGMPTVLPSSLSFDQERAYLLQLQIEEISRRLRTGDLGIPPNPEDRSPSPEPIYNSEGKRLNTREYRARKKLEDERHSLIQEMFSINTDYKPPADYKPPVVRVSEKVMIPQDEHPDINFVGLLIGPRGNTLKSMEKETGAKIIIRGKGSVKEGKVGRKDGQPLPGEDEPLHAFVTANNPESVKKAVDKIQEIVRQGVEVPEGQNDLRRMQLRELALLNGTLRENDSPRCSNCGATTHRGWQCPDKPNVTNNVVCTNCGGAGHIARDCRERKVGKPAFVSGDKSKIDEEYMSLMAELGEGPPPPTKTGTTTTQITHQGPSVLAGPQEPPRSIMAPPTIQHTQASLVQPYSWTSTPPAKHLSAAPPPPNQVQTLMVPPPGMFPQQNMSHWQQPGLTIHGVPPAPNLLTQPPPPPPPTTQPTVSTSVPWMNPQHTTGSQGNAMATVLPPWQTGNPSQSMGAAPMPVPPPHSNPVSGSQSFPWLTTGYMGVPPPPPVQPPLPPNLAAPPPPPPPACNTVTTTSQAVDLNNLTQSGLPSLLTAPPPPPPS